MSSVASDSIASGIPSVNVTEGIPSTPVKLLQFQTTRDIIALSPVPEAVEEAGTQLGEEGGAQAVEGTTGGRATAMTFGGSTLKSATEQLNKGML